GWQRRRRCAPASPRNVNVDRIREIGHRASSIGGAAHGLDANGPCGWCHHHLTSECALGRRSGSRSSKLTVVCTRERRTLHVDDTPVPVGRRGRTGIVSTDPVPSRWLQRRPDARAYPLGSRSRWPWLVRGTRAKENTNEA